jgi:hypothetical protein
VRCYYRSNSHLPTDITSIASITAVVLIFGGGLAIVLAATTINEANALEDSQINAISNDSKQGLNSQGSSEYNPGLTTTTTTPSIPIPVPNTEETKTSQDGSGQDKEDHSNKNTEDSEKKDTTPLRLPFP